jgi:hypothetical protein
VRATSAEERHIFFVCLQEKGPGNYLWSLFLCCSEERANDMERTRKQDTVPEGMALVETADGRWFAPFAPLSEIPHLKDVMGDPPLIPSSSDSFHDPGLGHDCCEEAIEACRAWREQEELDDGWRGLAARTELYPERNSWYLDEIVQMAGDDTPRLHCGISVYAMVLARQTTGNEVITATGNTPDEAIETLYQRVYQWSCQLHDTPCES